jgi:hypothetical protein
MNAPAHPDEVARLRQSFRRSEAVWWVLGTLLVLSGACVAASPGLRSGVARTEGTVVRIDHKKDFIQHGNPHAGEMVVLEEVVVGYSVVEYQVGDRKYTLTSSSRLAVGQKVPVLYEADRPEAATTDTRADRADRWDGPLLLGGVLVISGLVALAFAAHHRRTFRRVEATLTGRSRGAEGREGAAPAAPSPAEPSAASDRGG